MSALQIDNRQSDADARYGLADVRAEVLDDHAMTVLVRTTVGVLTAIAVAILVARAFGREGMAGRVLSLAPLLPVATGIALLAVALGAVPPRGEVALLVPAPAVIRPAGERSLSMLVSLRRPGNCLSPRGAPPRP